MNILNCSTKVNIFFRISWVRAKKKTGNLLLYTFPVHRSLNRSSFDLWQVILSTSFGRFPVGLLRQVPEFGRWISPLSSFRPAAF